MAESGLSGGFAELQTEVSDYLGLGRTAANLSTADTARVNAILKAGLRRFYGDYDWGFLKVIATMTTNAPYSTGTVTSSSTTVTLTTGTWPSWAANGEVTVDAVTYTVASRSSDSVIVLDTAPSSAFSADTFEIRQRDYEMPDNFGGSIIGEMHYRDTAAKKSNVSIRPQSEIRDRRARSDSSGEMVMAAIRPKASDGTDGQRWEVIFWPDPDAAYTIEYRYHQIQEDLDATNPYPLGGALHFEAIKCSCLARAELILNDEIGVWAHEYQQVLLRSIRRDQAADTAQFMPSYGNRSSTMQLDDRLTGFATVDGSKSDA